MQKKTDKRATYINRYQRCVQLYMRKVYELFIYLFILFRTINDMHNFPF